uniref:Nebulette n=1 Tax=Seriola lalandi dorsalis TaxID=1841481 RepID=A0A3B4XCZ2_SERLL
MWWVYRAVTSCVCVCVCVCVCQVKYKQAGKQQAASSLYSKLPETLETKHAKEATELQSEVSVHLHLSVCFLPRSTKYKEAGKREVSSSLYSKLPETLDTLRAKEVSQLQSQVLSAGFYKEQYNREKGKSSYTNMKTLPEVEHAMEVNKNQSEIGYRKGKEELHHYNTEPDRPDIINAANAAKLASDVSLLPSMHWVYHRANGHVQVVDLSRPLPQVKYKESFDRHLKGQRPRYNPLDCLSFKHKQAAAALASQVEYKKKYEQTKAHYHVALDTAEQLHHKENAVLHSQVKYREEYEKSKGRSQMEFGDTQTYRVSKEAQKMQSEREYRRDYEEQMKGKALVDVDQTPGYLTTLTPVMDMERDVVGKGMELSADVLEIQRAKRASAIQKIILIAGISFCRNQRLVTRVSGPLF